jgi:hypothetical protein
MWILLNRLLRLQHPASHHHCHQSSSTLRSGSCAVGCDGIRRRYGKANHRRRIRACCCCSSYSSSFHSRGNSSGRPGDEPDAGLEQRVRVGRQHERGQRHDGTAHVAGVGPAGGTFGAGREPLVKEWNECRVEPAHNFDPMWGARDKGRLRLTSTLGGKPKRTRKRFQKEKRLIT